MSPHESRPFQRMRKITTVGAVIAVAVAGLTHLIVSDGTWWFTLTQIPAMVIATWSASKWQTGLTPRQLLPALAIGLLSWAAGVLLDMGPMSLLGFVVPASVTLATMRRGRALAAAGVVLFVLATGLIVTAIQPQAATGYLITTLMYTLMFISVFWLNYITWSIVFELETLRKTETELALMQERFRFASDLHDIQGHTLHVIKLKAAVAAKLQHTDPDRTAAELADIQRLTAETIEQARELANSTHSLTFASELANADALLDAAGIRVNLEQQGEIPQANDATFALVLREATTNVLRHTRATRVDIAVDPNALRISNNGSKKTDGPLRGLASLRTRVADAGGALHIEHEGDVFALQLEFAKEIA